jgi:hypothetical protein
MYTSEGISIPTHIHKPVTLKPVKDHRKVFTGYSRGLFQFRKVKGVMGKCNDYSYLSLASE